MRRRNNILIERLITREIKKLLREEAYASNFARQIGSEALNILRKPGNFLSKSLSTVGLLDNAETFCTELANGKRDLSVLDEASNVMITTIAEIVGNSLIEINSKEIQKFAERSPGDVRDVVNTVGSGYPQMIKDCVVKIHGIIRDPKTSGLRRTLITVSHSLADIANGAWQGTKKVANDVGNGIVKGANAVADGAVSGYNTVKGWFGY